MEPDGSEQPSPTTVVERFGRYLKELGEPYVVDGFNPLAGGRSAESMGVRLRGPTGPLDVVLSLKNPTGPLADITDVARQFAVMQALQGTDVRVPRTLWCCPHAEPVGRPFMVTELVGGIVPDPWRADGRAFLARARRNERLLDDIVSQLVAIHAVNAGQLPASALDLGGLTGIGHELQQWNTIRADSAFAEDPVMTYAAQWLALHEPEPTIGLFHGDFRVGNLVIDDGRVAAVLDWEFAQLGDPRLDVATLESPVFAVNGLQDGLWPSGQFAERYERLGGRSIDPSTLHYLGRLATFKVVSVWVNSSRQFTAGAADLRALRGGFSVLDTRPALASAMGLPIDPPAVSSSGTGAAAQLLADVLRAEVRPALGDEPAREPLDLAVATLRAMASRSPLAVEIEFERDADVFLRDLATEFGGQLDDDQDTAIGVRLSRAIRSVLSELDRADGANDELYQRMRTLIGRAAHLSLGMWP